MTQEQYETFKAAVEKKGYKLHKVPRTIHNEHFYYYKGFAYPDKEDTQAGYQIIFLVWDFRPFRDGQSEDYEWGVTPLILTENHDWPRIDLEITVNDFNVDKLEKYASDFYNFVLTH
jgi:hypothetical protein